MSKIDDGGPAFPHSVAIGPGGDVYGSDYFGGSMSLRDWFAGQAINQMINMSQDADGGWSCDSVAVGCYLLADAMIKARALEVQS